MEPDVSVVIPAYNLSELLLEAVASVAEQRFEGRVETIVVDDASPRDLRGPLLERFPEVRYHRMTENGGTSAARHVGSRLARGRMIAYLDHDDVWLPEKLTRQVEAMEKHPEAGWVFCDAVKFSAGETAAQSIYEIFPQLRGGAVREGQGGAEARPVARGALIPLIFKYLFPIYPSTLLMRREALEAAGGWNPALRAAGEDWDLMIRASHRGTGLWQDAVLAKIRRRHGTNQSANILEHACIGQEGLERAQAGYPEELRRIVRPLLSRRLAGIGWSYYEAGDYGKAFEYYSRALGRGYVRPALLVKWAVAGVRRTKDK